MGSDENSSFSRASPTRKYCKYSLRLNPVALRNRRRNVRRPNFTQTITGNEMNTYAADVNELVEHFDLRDAIHIGS
jgi:hypothetical protein